MDGHGRTALGTRMYIHTCVRTWMQSTDGPAMALVHTNIRIHGAWMAWRHEIGGPWCWHVRGVSEIGDEARGGTDWTHDADAVTTHRVAQPLIPHPPGPRPAGRGFASPSPSLSLRLMSRAALRCNTHTPQAPVTTRGRRVGTGGDGEHAHLHLVRTLPRLDVCEHQPFLVRFVGGGLARGRASRQRQRRKRRVEHCNGPSDGGERTGQDD